MLYFPISVNILIWPWSSFVRFLVLLNVNNWFNLLQDSRAHVEDNSSRTGHYNSYFFDIQGVTHLYLAPKD